MRNLLVQTAVYAMQLTFKIAAFLIHFSLFMEVLNIIVMQKLTLPFYWNLKIVVFNFHFLSTSRVLRQNYLLSSNFHLYFSLKIKQIYPPTIICNWHYKVQFFDKY